MVVGMLGLLLPACSLDKFPTNQIVLEEAFQTIEDAARFNTGLYNELRRNSHSIFIGTSEMMSDLFNARQEFGNRGGFPHRLQTDFMGSYEPRDIWGNVFGSIAQTNFFLDGIVNIVPETTAQREAIDNFIAEAHYIRAKLYSILATHFMYPYSVANRNVPELGLPLLSTFDLHARPGRATIAETFAFILADLEAAKNINVDGAQNSTRITRDAVYALKARVHFMMGPDNRALAAQYANAVIETGRYPLVTTEAALRTMWTRDQSTEDIFRLHVTATSFGTSAQGAGANWNDHTTWTTNNMQAFSFFNAGLNAYQPDFIPTQTVIDLYGTGDMRLGVFFSDPTEQMVHITVPHPGVRILYKFRGNTDINVMYRHFPRVARIAEMYLIAAEAGNSLVRLNELREARGATPIALGDFERELRNEWVREFVGEGFRIKSLRRWGAENPANALTHWGLNDGIRTPQDPTAVHNYGSTEFTHRVVTPADFYRFTLPIPANDIRNNANMRQTPSWVH